MEFAVIKTGGKQYKVAVGDTLKIEKIIGDFKVGDKLSFEEVLLKEVGGKTLIGAPTLAKASVSATITEIDRLEKVLVVRYRQKSRYHKKNGHRQPYFGIKVDAIN